MGLCPVVNYDRLNMMRLTSVYTIYVHTQVLVIYYNKIVESSNNRGNPSLKVSSFCHL